MKFSFDHRTTLVSLTALIALTSLTAAEKVATPGPGSMMAYKPPTHPVSTLATPAWIKSEAHKLNAQPQVLVDFVRNTARQHIAAAGIPINELDVDALVQVVMMEASAETDADLRSELDEMQKANARKDALRDQHTDLALARARAKLQWHEEHKRQLQAALAGLKTNGSHSSDSSGKNPK